MSMSGIEWGVFRGQAVRFIATGIGVTLVDLAVLNLLIHFFPLRETVFGVSAYFSWKTVSFATAATCSYFANKYFAFRSKEKASVGEVSKFALVALAGFTLNVLVPVGLFSAFSSIAFLSSVLRANTASIAGTALSLVVNFFGYKLFVFKK